MFKQVGERERQHYSISDLQAFGGALPSLTKLVPSSSVKLIFFANLLLPLLQVPSWMLKQAFHSCTQLAYTLCQAHGVSSGKQDAYLQSSLL